MQDVSLLRLTSSSRMPSAQVFEALFDRHHASWFTVRREPLVPWLDGVLGRAGVGVDLPAAAAKLKRALDNVDFICPGYEAIRLVPLLLYLRNLAGSSVRLMLISHSPGESVYVFGLLVALLRPGDLIIAPSDFAARAILTLVPSLEPWVRTAHHPMDPLPERPGQTRMWQNHLVTLTRIVPDKLIHRQIDAFSLLLAKTGRDAVMTLAGDTRDMVTGDKTLYVRCLEAQVQRLGLAGRVRFPGMVRGRAAKADLLASADLMVYLSRTLEEAFPKAAVEALGAGVPVLAANWDGFPGIVGDAGCLLPLERRDGRGLDIDPEILAQAIDRLLDKPPDPVLCRKRAQGFDPSSSRRQYEEAVTHALSLDPAVGPTSLPNPQACLRSLLGPGLVREAGFLADLSFATAFDEYLSYAALTRRSWETGVPVPKRDPGFATEILVQQSLKRRLEDVYRGARNEMEKKEEKEEEEGGRRSGLGALPVPDRIQALSGSGAHPDLVDAGLIYLKATESIDALAETLNRSIQACRQSVTITYTAMWLDQMNGRPEDALARFRLWLEDRHLQEADWPLLDLLQSITAGLGQDRACLPWLEEWLDRWPDSVPSARIWLAKARALWNSGCADPARLDEAITRAGSFLVRHPAVNAMENLILASKAASEVREEPCS